MKSRAQRKQEAEARYNGNREALQERMKHLVSCNCKNPANCTTCRGTGAKLA